MNLFSFLLLLAAFAAFLLLARVWARLSFAAVLIGGAALVWVMLHLSTSSIDIFSVTLALVPTTRDYMAVALFLTGLLAAAISFVRDRSSLPILYWAWAAWVVALSVNDFVVSVFAWAIGFMALVLAMKPRKHQRASGSIFYLVVIVLATAGILLSSRFMALYPLTPERLELVQAAVLFLAWGMGLLLAVLPFHVWVGPMADDAPLPVTAAVLALGQPIGIWLLTRLFDEYPALLDKGNILQLLALGGLAAIITGGFMAAVERRAGRFLGYAAIFSMGFVLAELGQASQESLANAGLELLFRGIALTAMAVSITIGRSVRSEPIKRAALVTFLLGALSLVGIRIGVGMAGRWELLAEWASGDMRLFFLVLVAHSGLLVGTLRFARIWFETGEAPEEKVQEPVRVQAGAAVAVPASLPEMPGAGEEEREPIGPPLGTGPSVGTAPLVLEAVRTTAAPEAVALMHEASPPEAPGGIESVPAEEEYVFEEHVRKIARDLAARWGPQVNKGLRAVPFRAQSSLLGVWQSWPVWGGFALLVLLIALVVVSGLVPGVLYSHIARVFGAPQFVQ